MREEADMRKVHLPLLVQLVYQVYHALRPV